MKRRKYQRAGLFYEQQQRDQVREEEALQQQVLENLRMLRPQVNFEGPQQLPDPQQDALQEGIQKGIIETPDPYGTGQMWREHMKKKPLDNKTPATPRNWQMPLGLGMMGMRTLLAELAGRRERKRQDVYDMQQDILTNRMNTIPSSNFQPTYNNLYAQKGGKAIIKKQKLNTDVSIVDYMKSKFLNPSMDNRKYLFDELFKEDYVGTAEQNMKLLRDLKSGKFTAEDLHRDLYYLQNKDPQYLEMRYGGLKHHKYFGPPFSNGAKLSMSDGEKFDKSLVLRKIIPALFRYGRKYQDGGRLVNSVPEGYNFLREEGNRKYYNMTTNTSLPEAQSSSSTGGAAYEEFLRNKLRSGVSPEELVSKRYISPSAMENYRQFYKPIEDVVYTETNPLPQADQSAVFTEFYRGNKSNYSVYRPSRATNNPEGVIDSAGRLDVFGQPVVYGTPPKPKPVIRRGQKKTELPTPDLDFTIGQPTVGKTLNTVPLYDPSNPTKFSHTVPTGPYNEQRSIYFPDRKSWRKYISGQKVTSTQEGSDYGTSTGPMQLGGLAPKSRYTLNDVSADDIKTIRALHNKGLMNDKEGATWQRLADKYNFPYDTRINKYGLTDTIWTLDEKFISDLEKRIPAKKKTGPITNIPRPDLDFTVGQPIPGNQPNTIDLYDPSKPTPFSHTVPTGPYNQQQSIYFPDKDSWRKYISGQKVTSSQEGADYGTSTGPMKKGGIHIKKENKGKFTDYCGGKVTGECIEKGLNSPSATIRKRANFARNARKWNK